MRLVGERPTSVGRRVAMKSTSFNPHKGARVATYRVSTHGTTSAERAGCRPGLVVFKHRIGNAHLRLTGHPASGKDRPMAGSTRYGSPARSAGHHAHAAKSRMVNRQHAAHVVHGAVRAVRQDE